MWENMAIAWYWIPLIFCAGIDLSFAAQCCTCFSCFKTWNGRIFAVNINQLRRSKSSNLLIFYLDHALFELWRFSCNVNWTNIIVFFLPQIFYTCFVLILFWLMLFLFIWLPHIITRNHPFCTLLESKIHLFWNYAYEMVVQTSRLPRPLKQPTRKLWSTEEYLKIPYGSIKSLKWSTTQRWVSQANKHTNSLMI